MIKSRIITGQLILHGCLALLSSRHLGRVPFNSESDLRELFLGPRYLRQKILNRLLTLDQLRLLVTTLILNYKRII